MDSSIFAEVAYKSRFDRLLSTIDSLVTGGQSEVYRRLLCKSFAPDPLNLSLRLCKCARSSLDDLISLTFSPTID
jgi:hypothetical protein